MELLDQVGGTIRELVKCAPEEIGPSTISDLRRRTTTLIRRSTLEKGVRSVQRVPPAPQ
jgi:hypothetical protein